MLKGLDPLLSADLLQVLRAMGHGDEITLCDANFPADPVARQTASGRLIRLDGVDLIRSLRAVLSVLPLDTFVPCAAHRMEVVGDPSQIPPVMLEAQAEIDRAAGGSHPMGALERFAYYERAKRSYAIVATGELRFWGNVILTKGAIPPAA
jgi:L-fucose mutarotase